MRRHGPAATDRVEGAWARDQLHRLLSAEGVVAAAAEEPMEDFQVEEVAATVEDFMEVFPGLLEELPLVEEAQLQVMPSEDRPEEHSLAAAAEELQWCCLPLEMDHMVVMLHQHSVVPAAEVEEHLVPLMVGEAIQVVGEAVQVVEQHLVAVEATAVLAGEAAAVGRDLRSRVEGRGELRYAF